MSQIYRQLTFSTMYKEEVSHKYSYLKVKRLTRNDKRSLYGTVLVVKWLRIHPAIQEMRVQSLVRELISHMLWATRCSYQGRMPQLESLCTAREIPYAGTKT